MVAGLSAISGVSSTPLSITLRAIILALSASLVVLALARRRTRFSRGWFWLPFSLFWASYLVRLVADTVFEARGLSRPPEDYWIWAIGACLIPAVALLIKKDVEAYRLSFRLSLSMLMIGAIFVVALGDTIAVSIQTGLSQDYGRLNLRSLNANSVGHLGASLLILTLSQVISRSNRCSLLPRMSWAASFSLGVYLITSAGSRGAIVALLGVVIFLAVGLDLRRVWRVFALAGIIALIGYMLAAWFKETGQFYTVTRVVDAIAGQGGALELRQQAIQGALRQWARSPFIGDALDEETTQFYPHNVVAESLMATGVAGGIPFMVLIGFAVIRAYKLINWRSEHAWVGLIFVQYLIGAQFSGSIYDSTNLWTSLAAVIALSSGLRRSRAMALERTQVPRRSEE